MGAELTETFVIQIIALLQFCLWKLPIYGNPNSKEETCVYKTRSLTTPSWSFCLLPSAYVSLTTSHAWASVSERLYPALGWLLRHLHQILSTSRNYSLLPISALLHWARVFCLLDRHLDYLPMYRGVTLDSHQCSCFGNLVCFTRGLILSMNVLFLFSFML